MKQVLIYIKHYVNGEKMTENIDFWGAFILGMCFEAFIIGLGIFIWLKYYLNHTNIPLLIVSLINLMYCCIILFKKRKRTEKIKKIYNPYTGSYYLVKNGKIIGKIKK